MSAEVEIEIVFCGGNASPDDTHLAADVVGIDDEILEVLAARERRRHRNREQNKCSH